MLDSRRPIFQTSLWLVIKPLLHVSSRSPFRYQSYRPQHRNCPLNHSFPRSVLVGYLIMRKSFPILAFLAFAPLISAQTDSNSITVTASRTPNLQADQTVFGVSVISGLNATFEDVLGALQGSG